MAKSKQFIKEQKIDKNGKGITKLSPATFVRYREIYKRFLKGVSIADLSCEDNLTIQTIRQAISYMTKYCGYNFSDESEIRHAIQSIEDRNQEIRELKKTADQNNKFNMSLKCLQEVRKNDELRFRLKGLLNLKIEAPDEDNGKIIIMHYMGKNKEKASRVKNITPPDESAEEIEVQLES